MSTSLPTTGVIGGAVGLVTDGMLGGSTNEYKIDSLSGQYVDTFGGAVAVPDDGGYLIAATGNFPTGVDLVVTFSDGTTTRPCYSGVQGQGYVCRATNNSRLQFVAPPMPVGPVTVTVTPSGMSGFGIAANVVKRTFSSVVYDLRSETPEPRKVGPRRVGDEE